MRWGLFFLVMVSLTMFGCSKNEPSKAADGNLPKPGEAKKI